MTNLPFSKSYRMEVRLITTLLTCLFSCFICISSGDSLLVSAASPSLFGSVMASGPPVTRATPAISLFEVLFYYYHVSHLERTMNTINLVFAWGIIWFYPPENKSSKRLTSWLFTSAHVLLNTSSLWQSAENLHDHYKHIFIFLFCYYY